MNFEQQKQLPLSWVNRIFEIFIKTYGSEFEYKFGGTSNLELKVFWAEKLGGFDAVELKRGLDALSFEPKCPSLTRFMQLCRPALEPEAAWIEGQREYGNREAGRKFNFSHPAIFWAIAKVGENDFKTLKYEQIKERWKTALRDVFDYGGYLTIPALIKNEPEPVSQELATSLAEENIPILKKMNLSEKNDQKNWAHKILQSPQKYPHIAIKFANEALCKKNKEKK